MNCCAESTILYLNAGGKISGAERSLLTIFAALDRTRWQPVLAAPEGPLLAEAARLGVMCHPIPLMPLSRPSNITSTVQTLQKAARGSNQLRILLRNINPKIIHANSTSACCYLPFHCPAPIIWQVRDLTQLALLGKFCFQRAARVAVISQAVREAILPYAGSQSAKIVLLPPAVDTATFLPAAAAAQELFRAEHNLPAQIPLIGLIAQFVPWKRHHLFLDALSLISEFKWHALLAGADLYPQSGYLQSIKERIATPPLASRVSLLPWQSEQAKLFSALQLLVLTSEREPFGRVLIEAMSCQVPVIAVDEGGVRDIIQPGENGLLCAADADTLAEMMKEILHDTALAERLGKAARESVIQKFSLQQQSKDLDDIYNGLCEG